MAFRFNCPVCNAANNLHDNMRGRKVRCGKCEKVFVVPPAAAAQKKREEDEAIQEDRKIKVKTAAKRRPTDDDEDEDDDRPAERKKRPMPAKGGGTSTMMIVGGVGAALLLCLIGVVGIGAVWLLRARPVAGPVMAVAAPIKMDFKNDEPLPIKAPDAGKPLPDQMAPEVVKKVMEATVYLRVTMPGGQVAEGSGFFVFEPGIIVTNAHVLGMLRSSSKPPNQVEVVAYSGEPNELKMIGKVLGVDRDCDLAVVRVPVNAKLPTPLVLGDDRQLMQTQKVYIFGFPFGEKLGKNITVSSSTISSLRKDATGALKDVQVNGGMHPGNSGGPVVNSFGSLAGVSVSVITGTQINFAVPSEKVRNIMEGRLAASNWGEAYAQAGQPRLPIKYQCLDPLNRIREMRVEVWTGAPGQARPHSAEQPRPLPGESARQSHPVVYRDGAGSVEIPLPPLQAGHVYWLQPVFKTAKGMYWGPAQPASEEFAVLERKPANLTVDLSPQKERTAKMTSVFTDSIAYGKKKSVIVEEARADLLEVVQPVEMKGKLQTIPIKSAYGPVTISVVQDGKRVTINNYAQAMAHVRSMPPIFVVDSTNAVASYITVTLNPNNPLRNIVTDLNGMLHNGFEATTFKMPNRVVQPLESFPVKSSMLLRSNAPKAPGQPATIVDLMLTCTYEGMRVRNGREEAILTAVGTREGRANLKGKVKGDITGKIAFDIAGGFVAKAKLSIQSDVEENIPGLGSFTENTVQEISIERSVGNNLNLQLGKEKAPAAPKLPTDMAKPMAPNLAKGRILFAQNTALTATDPIDPTAGPGVNARMKVLSVKLQANVTYVISMNSTAFDSFLRLETAAGMEVARDDDSGGALNARILYRPAQSGMFRIIATSYQANSVGPFQLVVQELSATKGLPKGNPKGVPLKTAFQKPAKSTAPTSYLKVVSTVGDFIGQGKTYDYQGDQVKVKRTARGVHLSVDGWNADIGAPNGQFLQVGEYPDAKRFAFSGNSPGLDFFGKGRGSNAISGEFVVWELELNGDQIVRLAIDFVQRAEGKNAPLQGKLRVNSTLQ